MKNNLQRRGPEDVPPFTFYLNIENAQILHINILKRPIALFCPLSTAEPREYLPMPRVISAEGMDPI